MNKRRKKIKRRYTTDRIETISIFQENVCQYLSESLVERINKKLCYPMMDFFMYELQDKVFEET